MYLPPQFNPKDKAHALHVMRGHPLASLISVDDEGFPFVTHLPLHLAQADEPLVLLGHCAKANPHWRFLQARPRALVTFMGPQAYMSPKVYPDLVRVPTWSYLAVHARADVVFIDEPPSKDKLLKSLIGDHEPAYAAQWRGLETDYQQKMLNGIVAFELRITDLQCKLKLNQHRPESHAAMHAIYKAGNDNERALAAWMVTLGMVPEQAESPAAIKPFEGS
ncbi:FMN-binding negative transcriptional regulator [Limnohabitans sp. B9-3]|uniref:FMN-binding negative transcriptional regulator n=1 Tax=Limnohabitans sp. B9-3 TaxID=1100707 RepID=UPI000C1E67B3|nr:FMN-binding negative transcriptional regulator [Limnohabitans sp. B9-3]PIT74374.1 transcriptional regulator [Limnohabitans sp. B9-3]